MLHTTFLFLSLGKVLRKSFFFYKDFSNVRKRLDETEKRETTKKLTFVIVVCQTRKENVLNNEEMT